MSPNFNIVPKDIEGVLIYFDKIHERIEAIEASHKEVRDLVAKMEKRLMNMLIVVVVAVGAKYGLDLSGITP